MAALLFAGQLSRTNRCLHCTVCGVGGHGHFLFLIRAALVCHDFWSYHGLLSGG
jgi:hypothetical protein